MQNLGTDFPQSDVIYMARAIKLAQNGRFTTTPNPNVGCVIVDDDGRIVGEGFHHKAGGPHAEVVALRTAGNRTENCTAYVTLEPCSHHGRTPPCAEALIAAGVKKVVVAMSDPNPKVAGNGIAKLQDAGIEVAVGVLELEAEKLNRGFLKRMRQGKPWVTLKMATTLDGKTALLNGQSQWITGPEARADVQYHRAQSCAIISGSGTVMVDNPSLNVRHSELARGKYLIDSESLRQPMRVIVDGKGQLHSGLKLFSLDGQSLVVNLQENENLTAAKIPQWQAPESQGKVDLSALLDELGTRQMNQIWLEAGAKLGGAFLQENLVDELVLYLAPKLFGDLAMGAFSLSELTNIGDAKSLQWSDIRQVGNDIKITALLGNK